jgi:hypothetical protein
MSKDIQNFTLTPQTLQEAQQYAKLIADSDMVPQDYKGKPGNVLVAVQMGGEVGLNPIQSLQNIAVINGRPSIWGDALIALVRASPECEYVKEQVHRDDQGAPTYAEVRVKRKGEDEALRTFSRQEAEKAGLWGKQGPWQSYPSRMLQMRARAFALRDVFPDVLKGLHVAEEVQDIPAEKDMGTASTAAPEQTVESLNSQITGGQLEGAPDLEAPSTDDLLQRIKDAGTEDALHEIVPEAEKLDATNKDVVRAAYNSRLKEIRYGGQQNGDQEGEQADLAGAFEGDQ